MINTQTVSVVKSGLGKWYSTNRNIMELLRVGGATLLIDKQMNRRQSYLLGRIDYKLVVRQFHGYIIKHCRCLFILSVYLFAFINFIRQALFPEVNTLSIHIRFDSISPMGEILLCLPPRLFFWIFIGVIDLNSEFIYYPKFGMGAMNYYFQRICPTNQKNLKSVDSQFYWKIEARRKSKFKIV